MADTQAFEAWRDGRGLPDNLKAAFFMVWQAALASRHAEVDDEGLPGMPKEAANIWYHRGLPNFDDTDALQALDDGTGKAIPLFTAEQYRQGQRDAVAADRARRGAAGGGQ